MALFYNNLKCARCRDKGVDDDPCVLKRDCSICKAFTPEQILQLATPTYTTVGGTGSSLVQTTGDPALTATQPVQAPGTRGLETACKSATSPVEGPGTSVVIQQNATQPVEAPGAGTATQPAEAPGAGPAVLLTGTGSAALHAEITGSDSEEELQSEPGSPVDERTGPQTSTEMNQLIRNFLRSLLIERLSEA